MQSRTFGHMGAVWARWMPFLVPPLTEFKPGLLGKVWWYLTTSQAEMSTCSDHEMCRNLNEIVDSVCN